MAYSQDAYNAQDTSIAGKTLYNQQQKAKAKQEQSVPVPVPGLGEVPQTSSGIPGVPGFAPSPFYFGPNLQAPQGADWIPGGPPVSPEQLQMQQLQQFYAGLLGNSTAPPGPLQQYLQSLTGMQL